jgi:hypothetical protein
MGGKPGVSSANGNISKVRRAKLQTDAMLKVPKAKPGINVKAGAGHREYRLKVPSITLSGQANCLHHHLLPALIARVQQKITTTRTILGH